MKRISDFEGRTSDPVSVEYISTISGIIPVYSIKSFHSLTQFMLYECHNENNPYDNEQIKADFNELYQQMNGMPLREMDRIIYPVCKLCRDHERAGFVEGIKIGIQLDQELR